MTLTWGKVLAGGFPFVCAVIGATWLVRADRIEDLTARLTACERGSELSYPELVESMNDASIAWVTGSTR